jgi:hypothetical protein
MAAGAEAKAACTASPTVLKWTPPCAAMAESRSARWRWTAFAIAARSRSQSAVLPSMSVNRNVTVPVGRLAIGRLQRFSLERGWAGLSHGRSATMSKAIRREGR